MFGAVTVSLADLVTYGVVFAAGFYVGSKFTTAAGRFKSASQRVRNFFSTTKG